MEGAADAKPARKQGVSVSQLDEESLKRCERRLLSLNGLLFDSAMLASFARCAAIVAQR